MAPDGNPIINRILGLLLQVYALHENKSVNYTETFSRDYLLTFIRKMEDIIMYHFCAEDRDAMNQRDEQEREDWWQNTAMDKQAEQEAEYRDSLNNPSGNGH